MIVKITMRLVNWRYMDSLNQEELQNFISEQVIKPFYEKSLSNLNNLTLSGILRRKNPYLFKAKNIQTAEELAKYILDAFFSSQEETIFGNLMEGLAIFISEKLHGGRKAEQGKFKSIDLIFTKDHTVYIVGIKSGPYWGNKDQIDRLKNNFKKAKKILQEEGERNRIVAINGCIYGKDNNPHKVDRKNPGRSYYKYCGQEFWEFLTDDADFYQKIVMPIDKEAKKRDESFKKVYNGKLNELTKGILDNYLGTDHLVDWHKIIDYVSQKSNE